MKLQNARRLIALVAGLLTLVATSSQAASLVLTIDKTTGQIDWLDGFSISKTNSIADNRFGSFLTQDANMASPLLLYSGPGSHTNVSFDFSPDGSSIQGIGLSTTLPPGNGASFSGTPAGPATPVFSTGNISQFTALAFGDYTLNPVNGWNGGIEIKVIPEPNLTWLVILGAVGLFSFLRHRTKRPDQEIC